LEKARELGGREDGLAVVVVSRPDGTPVVSVVNPGVLEHPVTGQEVVGFVARGGARKLSYLRERAHVTVVFRSGWEWVAVEGEAELLGAHDALDGITPEDVTLVLRTVYVAAVGGTEEQWAALDTVMTAEGHTAVLLRPVRVYSNPER
jgi:hypothetical protein